MHPYTILFALGVLTAAPSAWAQYPGQDPDWPCAQRLVPTLTPGSYWNGPVPLNTGWRDDDKLFPLVTAIVSRDTPDTDAQMQLTHYADSIAPGQRATAYPALFGAIVDETNDERSLLVTRIKQLGLRQRRMGDVVARLSTQADQVPASDPKHNDLAGERDFDIQAFQETQHTMRYACEAPAAMERRLGVFARILETKLIAR